MTLHPLFVAGVLEGFEGTLGEVVGRIEDQELAAQLDALRGQVEALRLCIEEPFRQAEAAVARHPAGRRDELPVPISATGVTGTVDGTRDSSPPINGPGGRGARNTLRVVADVWNLPVLR
jgi:hypothetical protein